MWGVVLALQAKLMMEYILGLTILVLFGMLADLLLIIDRMLRLRGLDTVRISKVKGDADEALVRAGGARDLDRFGNNGADEAC